MDKEGKHSLMPKKEIIVVPYMKAYEDTVLEIAYRLCLRMDEKDLEKAFIIMVDREFVGFGYLAETDDYFEMNGPYFIEDVPDYILKQVVKEFVQRFMVHFNSKPLYFFTDYPETFEKLGCEVAFEAPSDILEKARPT